MFVNDEGFVYHNVTLDEAKNMYDVTQKVVQFAHMLPNRDKEGYLRFCFLDKDRGLLGRMGNGE
jgi:hypothetical protein